MPTMDSQRSDEAVCGTRSDIMTRRILILGGTLEARLLAGRLAERGDLDILLSLAGRTAQPLKQPAPVRIGGFGGAQGLAEHLETTGADLLVDATHPYAARIAHNAAIAARVAGIPIVALKRPSWDPREGDRWTSVEDTDGAIHVLGRTPRRVFVTLGRQELRPFAGAPQHAYLIRSVDPVKLPLGVPDATYIIARGPFDEAAERALLAEHRIEIIVSRNSGGPASYAKIVAARALGLEIVMLKRPALPEVTTATSIDEALAMIDHALASREKRGV